MSAEVQRQPLASQELPGAAGLELPGDGGHPLAARSRRGCVGAASAPKLPSGE